ncbi:quinol dehydrogenase ferredoxin subunit NapH [Campylobacter sp. MIT 21-1685]|uniref:quinol dehydrogenase ferredoxin subunit NapH n=1 Tax=unclassified Campylobacter TaxID=2593542 RepID=UPI00224B920A|nr:MULTISPECIES: quinol dehydrogenase ferredoxin subunit NapH [unclassified Campylobacter]MCX2682993.1 quinol dehydrogenase ferredoxin subunit NapH [Campylobacter sp. MIT 21-1684]MCX2751275.1 quinol dehydrogenase ferredoxin subunit NapH [Campylobacter sp. MIT 21-1682]MCX2807474.1 quinol dehydrogenase ferredoxin subunit NapH [Campylobacter sp. MIT 21-1685]
MRYLLARRMIQIGILVLFALPFTDFILQGNLSSSRFLSSIPLSDPFAVLQIFLASFSVDVMALFGAFVVLFLYAIVLGRVFCSWVCPVNIITDFAAFIRLKFGFKSKFVILSKNLRYGIVLLVLILSFILSLPVFESFSYIGIIHRGIIFGGASWLFVAFILFCIDTFLSPRAVCSHFCPLGAFYAVVSRFALLKVKHKVERCTKCYECIHICPEKQVLHMIGKISASVDSGECIRCGRCIEVCNDNALNFNLFDLRKEK